MSSATSSRRTERRRANPAPSPTETISAETIGRAEITLAGMALAFAVIGRPIAIYLTIQHYEGIAPSCPRADWFATLLSKLGAGINCGAVTSSPYSRVGPTNIPITVPGLGYFLISGTLAVWTILAGLGKVTAPRWLINAHMAWATIGLLFIIYLLYIEFGVLHLVCEWCTGVHILTLLTFFVVLIQWQRATTAKYRVVATE